MKSLKSVQPENPLSAENELKGRIADLKRQRTDAAKQHDEAVMVVRRTEIAIRGADIAIAELEEICSKLYPAQS